MQVTELVCPVAPENLPGTQSVQTVEAVLAAYLPAKQFMQVLAPAVAEYLPASHVKQALGELEKLPAGHWLSTQAEPRPANENLPAKQLMQVLATVAPTVVEYLPATQPSCHTSRLQSSTETSRLRRNGKRNLNLRSCHRQWNTVQMGTEVDHRSGCCRSPSRPGCLLGVGRSCSLQGR
jgi:hypothetical protein